MVPFILSQGQELQIHPSKGGPSAYPNGRGRDPDLQKQDKGPNKEGEDRSRPAQLAEEGVEEEKEVMCTYSDTAINHMLVHLREVYLKLSRLPIVRFSGCSEYCRVSRITKELLITERGVIGLLRYIDMPS